MPSSPVTVKPLRKNENTEGQEAEAAKSTIPNVETTSCRLRTGEVVLADNVCLDVFRLDARRRAIAWISFSIC